MRRRLPHLPASHHFVYGSLDVVRAHR
jgi:hypothetical protein